MKKTLQVAICFAATAGVAGPLWGQSTTSKPPPISATTGQSDYAGSAVRSLQIPSVRPDQDTPEGIKVYSQMIEFGRCASSLQGKFGAAALAAPPGSATERQGLARMREELRMCAPGRLPNILSLVRGSVAEGLYHKDEKAAGFAGWAADSEEYKAFYADQRAREAAVDSSDALVYAVTDCFAARRADLTAAVLSAKHGTPAEAAAMDKLFAGAPYCAGPTRPATLSRSFLRAFLSTSAYRVESWRERKADSK